MTPKQKENYLKNKGMRCPYCDTDDIVAHTVFDDGCGEAYAETFCWKCKNIRSKIS